MPQPQARVPRQACRPYPARLRALREASPRCVSLHQLMRSPLVHPRQKAMERAVRHELPVPAESSFGRRSSGQSGQRFLRDERHRAAARPAQVLAAPSPARRRLLPALVPSLSACAPGTPATYSARAGSTSPRVACPPGARSYTARSSAFEQSTASRSSPRSVIAVTSVAPIRSVRTGGHCRILKCQRHRYHRSHRLQQTDLAL